MAKTKQKSKKSENEPDGVYFLKIVLYLMIGSLWFKFVSIDGANQFPLPVGVIVGFIFASHEHFQIDRKIEYAVLLIAGLVGFWAPFGIYVLV